jgi:hypothetical protein
MKLIANCPIRGEYGFVATGQEFETQDGLAEQLIKNGMARKPVIPSVQYEIKPIEPSEAPKIAPERPFRDSHLHNEESAAVDTEGDQKLSATNVSSGRAVDSGRWSGHPRPDSGRGKSKTDSSR